MNILSSSLTFEAQTSGSCACRTDWWWGLHIMWNYFKFH